MGDLSMPSDLCPPRVVVELSMRHRSLIPIPMPLLACLFTGYSGLGWAKSKGYVKKTRKSKLTKTGAA